MNRRDFLKITVAGLAAAALPATLSMAAEGKEWQEFYATDFFDEQPRLSGLPHNYLVYVEAAFKRRMREGGFNEIRGMRYDVTYLAERSCWAVTAAASMR